MEISFVAVIVSALSTIVSALISVVGERQSKALTTSKNDIALRLGSIEPTEDSAKDCRLYELRNALQRQESISRLNAWADSLLAFGQYIIGGLLASSFVQKSVPAEVIGILGVLVLLSSIIRQRYRPDIKAVGAKRRAASLRSFIRKVEDSLYALKSGQENTSSVFDIRQKVTECLSKVEESEIADTQQDDNSNDQI